MSQVATQIEPSQIPRDAHPVTRVATEYFMRGFDALSQIQENVTDALIVATLVHGQVTAPRRGPVGVRELSRELGMPYETVRRRVGVLVQIRRLIARKGGLVVPAAVQRSRRVTEFLRKIYVEAARMLVALTRIDAAAFAPRSQRPAVTGRLTKEQTAIAMAAARLLLAAIRAMRAFWSDDLTKGLVFTAIWTANVKHVTNTAPAASHSILPDSQRLPVSGLAISRSLRLPYETVRRHASALVREGICTRAAGRGLVAPTVAHQRITLGTVITYRLVMDFLSELRRAGIKV